MRYEDGLKAVIDVDFVAHAISNKTFDFSKTTIQQLIQDGYKEIKQQIKEILTRG